MKKHVDYYKKNNNYSKFLELQQKSVFSKYIMMLRKFSSKDSSILDVGCGTGIVLEAISKGAKPVGLDVSDTSVNICLKKGLNAICYNGSKFPFSKNEFNVVGSMNVLEHVENPILFLDEQYRVLKDGGYLLVVCPNFLSLTNSYHPHMQGYIRKFKNLVTIVYKKVKSKTNFNEMSPIHRKKFMPDDDAITVSNPLDILYWASKKKLKLIYWSSQQQKTGGLKKMLDRGYFRYFLGACFFVFKKK